MRLGELSLSTLISLAQNGRLILETGPFNVRIKTASRSFLEYLRIIYGYYTVDTSERILSFDIFLSSPLGLRRWHRPQIRFLLDGQQLFDPFPASHAPPLFEWGLNWCIARRAHRYLLLHAAVLDKNGNALILPAHPGSGKSTLCAALSLKGWRLLSDEFGMIEPETGNVISIPRPIALKNQSIEVIRGRFTHATIGPLFPETRKGTVAHVQPNRQSVDGIRTPARPRWIVFPKYQADAALTLSPFAKPQSFMRLANNSFNYEVLGVRGFETVRRLIRQCDCRRLEYGNVDEARAVLDELERE